MSTEAPIQAGILQGLRKLGIWAIRMGRYHRRSATDPIPECGEDGMPDIWTPYGWIETKRSRGGVVSEDQRAWHFNARQHGIRVHVATSVEEGLRTVVEWRRDCRGS